MLVSLTRLFLCRPRPRREGESIVIERSGEWYGEEGEGDDGSLKKPIESRFARVMSRVDTGGVDGMSSTMIAGISRRDRS